MHNDNLHTLLDEIARQEVESTMNLWPNLQDQLRHVPHPSHRASLLRKVTVAVVVCLILVVSAVAYVFSQDGGDKSDPGIEGAKNSGLITEVEQSQSIEGIDVTLHWVYADTERVVANFGVTGLQESQWVQAVIGDPDGNIFSSSGGGASDPDPETGEITYEVNAYTQVMRPLPDGQGVDIDNDYFINQFGEIPETLPLVVTIVVHPQPTFQSEWEILRGEWAEGTIGPFHFEAEATMGQPHTIEVGQTVTVNDLNVTLQAITLAPSQTEVSFCYDLPDNRDWQPQATLQLGDESGLWSGGGMTQRATLEDTSRCFNWDFNIFYDGNPATLIFTVERLRPSEAIESPEFWEQVMAELAGTGIEVGIDVSNHGVRMVAPEGMSDEDAWALIEAAKQRVLPPILGPWTFRVELE